VFNSLKASAVPTFRSIGSCVSNNEDLIAKPLLGAVGSIAAGVLTLISHIMNKNKEHVTIDDTKYTEMLQSILPTTTPVTNMIESGVKNVQLEKRF